MLKSHPMANLTLSSPIQYVKGVGPKIAKLFSRLGVETVSDLVFFFPRDYFDRSSISPIAKVDQDQQVIIRGSITKVSHHKTRGGFSILKATIMDKTGVLNAVWFNQPYLSNILKRGTKILASGKAQFNSYSGEMELNIRDWEIIEEKETLPIMPKYPLTEGLFQKKTRNIVDQALSACLSQVKDPLPERIKDKYGLADLRSSIRVLHFPPAMEMVKPAHRRLAFDDFFIFQLGLLYRRAAYNNNVKGIRFEPEGELVSKFLSDMPFKLTRSQERVFSEIANDMSDEHPMARLLQGDVGSGKTVVAMLAALIAVQSGYQAAIMVPTEILAAQHFKRISEMISRLDLRIDMLVSSIGAARRKDVLERLSKGKIDIIIGTHAVIEEDVNFKNLGLVIIDEQHRFGVVQRASLGRKGQNPDILVMTATPIPRSLALTLFGDLDRSVIDELPPGRTPVQTIFVDDAKRARAYEFIRQEVSAGRQVFVVCPLIEESEVLDLKAAKLEAENLQKKVFPEFKVGLLHGRLKADEKDRIMRQFGSGEIKILVSTTVIEVGIDYPNASIMFIEHAERFGLAQLHQLRGRIGRGAAKSYCLLSGDIRSDDAKARMKAMLSSTDGFKIAEEDLKIRGPGDFWGQRQAGLPTFRIADIIIDADILGSARAAAEDVLKEDPKLLKQDNLALKEELNSRYGSLLELGTLN